MIKTYRHILFDLDGTLLDTAPDLLMAVNEVLEKHNLPTENLATLKNRVHGGSKMLLGKAFNLAEEDPKFDKLKQEFLDHYLNHINDHTEYFAGVEKLLMTLNQKNISWGIVTNKPDWLTEPLLRQYPLLSDAKCLVCGNTLPVQKPHPDPILLALTQTSFRAEHTLFIGDSINDMVAGEQADVDTAIAAYGYIPSEDDMQQWPHQIVLKKPIDLLNHLN